MREDGARWEMGTIFAKEIFALVCPIFILSQTQVAHKLRLLQEELKIFRSTASLEAGSEFGVIEHDEQDLYSLRV